MSAGPSTAVRPWCGNTSTEVHFKAMVDGCIWTHFLQSCLHLGLQTVCSCVRMLRQQKLWVWFPHLLNTPCQCSPSLGEITAVPEWGVACPFWKIIRSLSHSLDICSPWFSIYVYKWITLLAIIRCFLPHISGPHHFIELFCIWLQGHYCGSSTVGGKQMSVHSFLKIFIACHSVCASLILIHGSLACS